jgi:hypothetical protein
MAAGLVLAASASVANAASATGLEAFVGRWQMNVAKTKMGRMGPNGKNIVRAPTFTWVFTADGRGLKMDVYSEYPQPAPTRTMTVIADQKARPCLSQTCLTTGGDPNEQTYAYYRMDSHMLARLFYTKGQVVEYSSYAVSMDGKVLTIISWSPETPEYQNIQVFDKQP